jgi:enoyl-CoA hydratase/carnithine racemase
VIESLNSPYETLVLEERAPGVVVATLNRPERYNAMTNTMFVELERMALELGAEDDLRVLILTGAGKAFCAGGDVKSMKARLDAPQTKVAIDGWHRQQRTAAMVASLHSAGAVTIAAVNGAAMGLGMDLALACDFIVAAPEATFGATFVKRGLIPDGGSLYFLPRRIGLQRTKELIYSGRTVDSAEALELGLVDRVSGAGTLLDDTAEFAAQFTANSAPAIALMKSIVDRSYETSLADIAQLGGQAQSISYTTEEHRASVEAFLKK